MLPLMLPSQDMNPNTCATCQHFARSPDKHFWGRCYAPFPVTQPLLTNSGLVRETWYNCDQHKPVETTKEQQT